MKFGLFYQLPCADAQSETVRYQETMEQVAHGDALGFDCAWLAELHFYKAFSIMSSPLYVATAIAQRTKRIRLGIAVNLLPLNHPLRSAEEGATVDILTNGRLELALVVERFLYILPDITFRVTRVVSVLKKQLK